MQMVSLLFILAVCAANFAIGFGLAVRMGHGPAKLVQKFAAATQDSGAHEHTQPAESAHSK
jgi:hypothetical protein